MIILFIPSVIWATPYSQDISIFSGGRGDGSGSNYSMSVITGNATLSQIGTGKKFLAHAGTEPFLIGRIQQLPVANAGQDQIVDENSFVMLDGSLSTVPGSLDPIYQWEQTYGPEVMLSNPTIANPTFVAPEVVIDGMILAFQLTILDEKNQQASDSVIIYLKNVPQFYTIQTIVSEGGTITPMTDVQVFEGQSQYFQIMPDQGFQVTDILIDGVSVGPAKFYTFRQVMEHHSIDVTFHKMPVLTIQSHGEGAVKPEGRLEINPGNDQYVMFIPKNGFRIQEVTIDDQSVGTPAYYYFTDIITDHEVHVYFEKIVFTIQSTANEHGQISPSGTITVPVGTHQTFTITPEPGFEIESLFVNGQTESPRSTYTFWHVSNSHTISASFRAKPTIHASAENHGRIEPQGDIIVPYATEKEFMILADPGYLISHVDIDGKSYGAISHFRFSNVISDHSIAAYFVKKESVLTIQLLTGEGGLITPWDSTGFIEVLDHGKISFTIGSDPAYELIDVIIDGISVGPIHFYAFDNIIQDHIIEIQCQQTRFYIQASAEANGSIEPEGTFIKDPGEYQTFSIHPNEGYRILDVLVDGVSQGRPSFYYFKNIDQNHSLVATFAPDYYHIKTATSDYGSITPAGDIHVKENADQEFIFLPDPGYEVASVILDNQPIGVHPSFTFFQVTTNHDLTVNFTKQPIINATADHNGQISPTGQIFVTSGHYQSFSFMPSNGYGIADVIVDGISQGPLPNYVFWDVLTDHSIHVSFKTYELTVIQPSHGEISPSGVIPIECEQNKTFVMTPQDGYALLDVIIDGQSIGPTPQYTFWQVKDDHTITALFQALPRHTITVTASQGGTISPGADMGMVNVVQGDYPEFLIQAVSGYRIRSVFIDQVSIGRKSYYIFKDVHMNHSISAEFEKIPTVTVTASNSSGGHIEPSGDLELQVGSYQLYTITPDPDYRILDLLVDDVSVGPFSTYPLLANKNYTLMATFIEKDNRILAGRVMPSDQPNLGLVNCYVEVRYNNRFLAGALTNEFGYYSIDGLPKVEKLIVSAWPPFGNASYHGLYYQNQEDYFSANHVSLLESNQESINFVLPTTSRSGIMGRIHDGTKGLPNVSVDIVSVDSQDAMSVITDAMGSYTAMGLSSNERYQASVWWADLRTTFYFALPEGGTPGVQIPVSSVITQNKATLVSSNDPPVKHIDIIINSEQGAFIEGHVFLADEDTPVSNIWVNAWSNGLQTGNSALTDQNGLFRITGLISVKPQDVNKKGYIVEVRDDKYAYQAFPSAFYPEKATPVMTGRSDIEIFVHNQLSISGKVIQISQMPIPNVQIIAVIQTSPLDWISQTLTDPTGSFQLSGLPPAKDYILIAKGNGFPEYYYKNAKEISNATPINLYNGNVSDITIQLDKGLIVQGQLWIDQQGTSAPSGIWVKLFSPSTQDSKSVQTNALGQFEFTGLQNAIQDYILSVLYDTYLPAYYQEDAQDTTGHSSTLATSIIPEYSINALSYNLLLTKGLSLKGLIIDPSGQAVKDAHVSVFCSETNGWGTAKTHTDVLENFAIQGLSPGIYHIQVQSDLFADHNSTLELNHTQSITIQLSLPDRAISGIITGLPKDKDAIIVARSETLHGQKQITIQGSGQPYAYTIMGLKPASDYTLELTVDGQRPIIFDNQTNWHLANFIDVSNQSQSNIHFQIPNNTMFGQISGTIILPDALSRNDTVWIDVISSNAGVHETQPIIYQESLNIPYSLNDLPLASDYVVMVRSNSFIDQVYLNAMDLESAQPLDLIQTPQQTGIDFSLTQGASISGMILDAQGLPVDGINVKTHSINLHSQASTTTDQKGEFQINGLINAQEYIISFELNNGGMFYYASPYPVIQENRALAIQTNIALPSQITIRLFDMGDIQGRVMDESGKGLPQIWVDAFSSSLQSGNGAFTNKDGTYHIQNLANATDYRVTAKPDTSAPFVQQAHTQIEVNSQSIDFILKAREGVALSGTVKTLTNQPVENAIIRIESINNPDQSYWTASDLNGQYEINHIPIGLDYRLMIEPPDNEPLAYSSITPFPVTQTVYLPVQLSPAFTMCGTVIQKSDKTPIQGAIVIIRSTAANYRAETTTNYKGYYSFSHAPSADDYDMSVQKATYLEENLSQLRPTCPIDFQLSHSGHIAGKVIDQKTNTPISNAMIEVYSDSRKGANEFSGIAFSKSDGTFEVTGLPIYDQFDNQVIDYVVIAIAQGYPELIKGNKKTDDWVEFGLMATNTSMLNGRITNAEGLSVVVQIYKPNGSFIVSGLANDAGQFSIQGLSSYQTYDVFFVPYNNNIELSGEWATANGTGSSDRNLAGQFSTAQTLQFSFSQQPTQGITRKKYQGPGPVRNLHSTTHAFYRITSAGRVEQPDNGPDNISRNPNVNVAWDPPDIGAENIAGYYHSFTQESTLELNALNTSAQKPIKTRKITSDDLQGDDVAYYFHVAPVDREGRLGATTSIAFRIDTEPPTHVNVQAPENTSFQSIELGIGASGAFEMFISNTTYEQEGQWLPIKKNSDWRLTEGTGPKKIYVSVKDRAGNKSNALATTLFNDVTFTYQITTSPTVNGHIEPINPVVEKGQSIELKIFPDHGYTLDQVLIDQHAQNIQNNTINLSQVTSDHQVDVTFKRIQYQITTVAGTNGQVNPNGNMTVNALDQMTIEITPNSGYAIGKATLNDLPIEISNQSLTLESISMNYRFVVEFIKANPITVIEENNGSITPSGVQMVPYGGMMTMQIKPDPGYSIDSIIVDDVPVTLSGDRYTFLNVVAPHSIRGTFKQEEFTIIAISGAHGKLDPSDTVIVKGGDSQAFSILPDPEFEVDQVMVDGQVVSITQNMYTFSHVDAQHTLTVLFRPLNHIPVIQSAFVITEEDTPVSGQLKAEDPDGTPVSFLIAQQGEKGQAEINSQTGAFTYYPHVNQNGMDTFYVTASDGIDTANPASVRVEIQSINDAPMTESITLTLAEDTSLSYTLPAIDPDNDAITFEIIEYPEKGQITLVNENTGAFIYIPNQNITGQDIIRFSVTDPHAETNEGTVNLLIQPINDLPVIKGGQMVLLEDTPTWYTFIASDIDGDVLSFSIVKHPEKGIVTITDQTHGVIRFTPDANIYGDDNLSFRVSDGNDWTDPADISILIQSVNDAPEIRHHLLETVKGNSVSVTLSATDVESDPLTFTIMDAPAYGTLSFNGWQVTYIPDIIFQGVDRFTYAVSDGKILSSKASVTINVNAPSDISTDEDVPVQITLEGVGIIERLPDHGTLSGTSPYLIYTPYENYYGEDQFNYSINQAIKTMLIYVRPVNDLPIFDSMSTFNLLEDIPTSISVNVKDPDGNPVTMSILKQPNHGQANVIESDKNDVLYTPFKDYQGTDQFTVRADDGFGYSDQVIHLSIAPMNDAPVANGQSIETMEDQSISIRLTGSDIENDALTFFISVDPQHGTLIGSPPHITYMPHANYFGEDSFLFMASDGRLPSELATIAIVIHPRNDIPVAKPGHMTLFEDQSKSGQLNGYDIDEDALTFIIAEQGHKGTVTLENSLTGQFTYQPFANQFGEDAFYFYVSDGEFNSYSAIQSVYITPVNDPPIIYARTIETIEDMAKTDTIRFDDIESDHITFKIIQPPAKGVVSFNKLVSGTFTYTPNANQNGTDQFICKASDSDADSLTSAIIHITILPVNDAPVGLSDVFETDEDSLFSGSLFGSDVDEDDLIYELVTNGQLGTVDITDASKGTFIYSPFANTYGLDTFSFHVSDGTLQSAPVEISVTIHPMNDAPVAHPRDNVEISENSVSTIELKGSDMDHDALIYEIVDAPFHGQIIELTDNYVTYSPAQGYWEDRFSYRVFDGKTYSTAATVMLWIGVPSAQIVTWEDTPVAVSVDPNAKILKQPAFGQLTGQIPILEYVPNPNYFGSDQFKYRVGDSGPEQTLSIYIKSVNDPPTITPMSIVKILEDSHAHIQLLISDVDNALTQLTYTVSRQPMHGNVTTSNENLWYTPATNYFGQDSITYDVRDELGGLASVIIQIAIESVNDAPIAKSIQVETNEETDVSITLSGSDIENNPLTYTIITQPIHGVLSGHLPHVIYTPDINFDQIEQFTYYVFDGQTASQPAQVFIKVNRINDQPVALDSYLEVLANNDLQGTMLAEDPDTNDDLRFSITRNPVKGEVIMTNPYTGQFLYYPKSNVSGADSFMFQVMDISGAYSMATVHITIQSGPVINDSYQLFIHLTQAYQEGDLFRYTLISTSTGHIVIDKTTNQATIQERLEPGTYRLFIIGDGYAPYEYQSNENRRIQIIDHDVSIESPLTNGDYTSNSPSADMSHILLDDGFILQVVKKNFNNCRIRILTNTPEGGTWVENIIGNGTSTTPYNWHWTPQQPYTQIETDQGQPMYEISFEIYGDQNITPLATYTVRFMNDADQLKQEDQRSFENEYGETKSTIHGEHLFYPVIGTTFHIMVTDSQGNDTPIEINIPPIPLDYLYIDQTQTNALHYQASTDYYQIDTNALHPASTDKLKIIVSYYTFLDQEIGTGVSIDFEIAEGQYAGYGVRYNPILNSSGKRASEVKNETLPEITLPIVLNKNHPSYDTLTQRLSDQTILPVLVKEKGDGEQGFRKEAASFYRDEELLFVSIQHLTSLGIDWSLYRSSSDNTFVPSEESGGGCFIEMILPVYFRGCNPILGQKK